MDFDYNSSEDKELIEEEIAEEINQFVDETSPINVESPTGIVNELQAEKDAAKNE